MAATQSEPELSVVSQREKEPQASQEASPPGPPASTSPERAAQWLRRDGLPWWLLLFALAASAALYFNQYQRAERLSAEATALRAELAQVGRELNAYRSHLEAIRIGADELAGRVVALRALAHRDPSARAAGRDESSPSSLDPQRDAPSEAPISDDLPDRLSTAGEPPIGSEPRALGTH